MHKKGFFFTNYIDDLIGCDEVAIAAFQKCPSILSGSLLYIHKCVSPARLFVNRILATLREAPDNGPINLTRGISKGYGVV